MYDAHYFGKISITSIQWMLHPRRPRGSQSGREKRRDESFQVRAEEPLGTDSHRTISKNSSGCRLLIGHKKMLCIIEPNRRTVSPEFFSWVRTRRLLSRYTFPVRSPCLCVQGKLYHAFLYISLPSPARLPVKMPNFKFYEGRKQAMTKFILFMNLDMVDRNSAPEEFACIWQSKRVGIITIETEKNMNSNFHATFSWLSAIYRFSQGFKRVEAPINSNL